MVNKVTPSILAEILQNVSLKYNDTYKMLYFFMHDKKKLVSWFINDMIRNSRFYIYANNKDTFIPQSIPMQCWSIDIFSDQESSESEIFLHEGNKSELGHNLISFNDIITEEFKNINYYQFFYKDERVTCTLIITAIEEFKAFTPALVIGTNYGRIFIVSLFQRSEGKANPVILMDFHFGNMITGLFLASNKYLFSISEEGTVWITHISSHALQEKFDKLESFTTKITPIEKKRFDRQIKDIQRDYRSKRRSSFTSYAKNMWTFIKIHFTKRFKDLSPFGITKILEVKDVESLRGQNRQEETKIDATKVRMKKLREYAFVGDDNVVFLFSLKTMQIQKLLSCDSHAIGIYLDSINNYYFVLTKELNILYFNKVTMTLERRGDFDDASHILCLDDIIQSIFNSNEIFQSKDLTDVSINDFETFDKICERKNMYMEFGKHKTLDYLNLSLNMPLNYHDLWLYSKKYTKALHDFLRIKPNLREIETDELKRKRMLITLNSILYLNNHLYNSDANEKDYTYNGVNFIKAHIGTKSMRGNNQQIMIVNLKMVIKNIRKHVFNEHDSAFDEFESSDEFEYYEDDYSHDELKIKKRSSSYHDETPNSYGRRRTISKMAEGNDFEDFKQAQSMAQESSKRSNAPKIRKSRGDSTGSHSSKDLHDEDQCTWPLTLMSLFHPFRLSDPLDIDIEHLFKLSLPFLDIRIGVQGVAESFTFVIAKNKPK